MRRNERNAYLTKFRTVYCFEPVSGGGLLRRTQRALERQIVADRLVSLRSDIASLERQLLRRTPPPWIRDPRQASEKALKAALEKLKQRYAQAQVLARAFRLHPDQPFKLR